MRDIAGYGYSSSRLDSTRAELSSAQFSPVQFTLAWFGSVSGPHTAQWGAAGLAPKKLKERYDREREIEGDGEREWK